MSRIVAPLLSFGASGQIGKSQVYASWKGRPYARRYVIPSNPKSEAQTETRNTFAWLNNVWRYMPTDAIAAWEAYGKNSRFTSRNGFIKQNLSDLRSETDLTNFIFSPSANGGIAAVTMSPAAGDTELVVTLGAPPLPAGWTIVRATAAAIRQQDPQTGTLYGIVAATDETDPYEVTIAGLTNDVEYVVGGWFTFQKAPNKFAYGAALMDTATPTV